MGEQDEASKRKTAWRQRKVMVFTILMGFLVAAGSLGGLLAGYFANGGTLYGDPAIPLGLSVLGLALSLIVVDRLTKKVLTKWIA